MGPLISEAERVVTGQHTLRFLPVQQMFLPEVGATVQRCDDPPEEKQSEG